MDISMIDSLKREMAKEIINNFIDGMKNIGFNAEELLEVVKDKVKEEF